MASVNIGNRCIVAANSVVTKDVRDQTIVGGVPARVIEIVPGAGDCGLVGRPDRSCLTARGLLRFLNT